MHKWKQKMEKTENQTIKMVSSNLRKITQKLKY